MVWLTLNATGYSYSEPKPSLFKYVEAPRIQHETTANPHGLELVANPLTRLFSPLA